jgi:hypothetical protein
MRLPPPPALLDKQIFDGREYETEDMVEVLAALYNVKRADRERTWKYRTLIKAHREQHAKSLSRKGYPYDWKSLSKKSGNDWKTVVLVVDESGISIKKEVEDYCQRGKLPLAALQRGSDVLRDAERQLIVEWRAKILRRRRRWRRIRNFFGLGVK